MIKTDYYTDADFEKQMAQFANELNESEKPKANNKKHSGKIIDIVSKKQNAFPYQVFPEVIQAVINEWHKAFPIPSEYYAAGILAAFSGAIGNSVKIEYKRGYTEPALLYMALVGSPGLGKTPALNKAINPLINKEIEYRDAYKEAKATFAQLSAEAKEDKGEKPPSPLCRELIIDDSTTEAVAGLMHDNPKGLTLIKDELMGFIGNMNKYNKGADAEFWLSTWSNTTAKTNRSTKETIFVKSSYVTIVGGIQKNVVKKLTTQDNVNNGFAARFLFVVPDSFDRKKDTDYEPDLTIIDKYSKALNTLFESLESACGSPVLHDGYLIGCGINPAIIRMTTEAKTIFRDWKNSMVDKGNNSSSDWERGSLTKLEAYCLRFSLILELMNASCNDIEIKKTGDEKEPAMNISIQPETVTRAIQLCGYFEATMEAIIDNVSLTKEEAILSELPKNHLAFYNALPIDFYTHEAMELKEKFKMSKSTVNRLFKNEALFFIEGRGHYKKLLTVNEI